MTDLAFVEDSPIFWELVHKYKGKFDESPWSPEFLETDPEPTEEEIKARRWPVTFDGALEYARRLVLAHEITQVMPILALDQYAQYVELDDAQVQEILQGVIVDD